MEKPEPKYSIEDKVKFKAYDGSIVIGEIEHIINPNINDYEYEYEIWDEDEEYYCILESDIIEKINN